MGINDGHSAVERHALADLMLEDVQIVEPIRLGAAGVPEGESIGVFWYAVSVSCTGEPEIQRHRLWTQGLAVSVTPEGFFPSVRVGLRAVARFRC